MLNILTTKNNLLYLKPERTTHIDGVKCCLSSYYKDRIHPIFSNDTHTNIIAVLIDSK